MAFPGSQSVSQEGVWMDGQAGNWQGGWVGAPSPFMPWDGLLREGGSRAAGAAAEARASGRRDPPNAHNPTPPSVPLNHQITGSR